MCDFTNGKFQWIIEDIEYGKAIGTKKDTKRLGIITGQVYTDLYRRRERLKDKKPAFLKIEQLHPFPFEQLHDTLNSYPHLEDIV